MTEWKTISRRFALSTIGDWPRKDAAAIMAARRRYDEGETILCHKHQDGFVYLVEKPRKHTDHYHCPWFGDQYPSWAR